MFFYTVGSLHDRVDFLSNSHLVLLRLSVSHIRAKWSFASLWLHGYLVRQCVNYRPKPSPTRQIKNPLVYTAYDVLSCLLYGHLRRVYAYFWHFGGLIGTVDTRKVF